MGKLRQHPETGSHESSNPSSGMLKFTTEVLQIALLNPHLNITYEITVKSQPFRDLHYRVYIGCGKLRRQIVMSSMLIDTHLVKSVSIPILSDAPPDWLIATSKELQVIHACIPCMPIGLHKIIRTHTHFRQTFCTGRDRYINKV